MIADGRAIKIKAQWRFIWYVFLFTRTKKTFPMWKCKQLFQAPGTKGKFFLCPNHPSNLSPRSRPQSQSSSLFFHSSVSSSRFSLFNYFYLSLSLTQTQKKKRKVMKRKTGREKETDRKGRRQRARQSRFKTTIFSVETLAQHLWFPPPIVARQAFLVAHQAFFRCE